MSAQPKVNTVPAAADQSLTALVKSALADIGQLVKKEKELAIAEGVQAAKRLAPAAVAFGVAALAGFFVLLFVSVSGAYGIGDLLTVGWGFLIVTGVWTVVLVIAGLFGRSQLKKVTGPERTVRTVKDTAEWARHPTERPAGHVITAAPVTTVPVAAVTAATANAATVTAD